MKIKERDLFYLEIINRQGLGDRVVFKIPEVEDMLGIPKEQIIEAIRSGKLKYKRFSHEEMSWRIQVSRLLDYYRGSVVSSES